MNFIRYKDEAIVNLERVTSVTAIKKQRVIYFEFDAMNNDETNCVRWQLVSDEDFEKVISHLSITEI